MARPDAADPSSTDGGDTTTTTTTITTATTGAGSPIARVGPHPGFISSSNQYSSEIKVRRMLKDNMCDPAREDNYRLQGVQLIDNVREHLQLYVFIFIFFLSFLPPNVSFFPSLMTYRCLAVFNSLSFLVVSFVDERRI